MKTTFLFTLLLCTFTVAFSQDQQNDATWEETIDFIKKYSSELKILFDDDDLKPEGANWEDYKEEWDIQVTSEFIRFKLIYETSYDDICSIRKNGIEYLCDEGAKTECLITIYFKGLTADNDPSLDYPRLDFIDSRHVVVKEAGLLRDCKVMYGDRVGSVDYYRKYYKSDAFIWWKSLGEDYEIKEMNQRLANAFHHLSVLADKRREEERKQKEKERRAAGEKF